MAHKNLASERVRLGMTQTDLAHVLGVSTQTIVRWEKDVSVMPMRGINRAAEYFGCSVDYLADRTDERLAQI